MKRGLRVAMDYLKDCDMELIPEVLHSLAKIEVMVHTLSHSLRRAAKGGNGEVLVAYHPNQSGVNIACYRYNYDYKAPERAVWYWFTSKSVPVASPLYHSLEAMKSDPMYSEGCKIWTGDHSRPILWEGKQ